MHASAILLALALTTHVLERSAYTYRKCVVSSDSISCLPCTIANARDNIASAFSEVRFQIDDDFEELTFQHGIK